MNSTFFAKVSLHKLVSELVESLLPAAVRRYNLVLNEISRDLYVGADEHMLAYVLWNLINGAVHSTHNECIHIEATTTDDRLMVRIKDVGTYYRDVISGNYRQIQHVAQRLGGSICIESGEEYGMNAAFCIWNSQAAA